MLFLVKMVQQWIRNGCVVFLQLRRPELGRDGRPGEHPAMAGEDGPSFCLNIRLYQHLAKLDAISQIKNE